MADELLPLLQGVTPELNANLSNESHAAIVRRLAANMQVIRPFDGEFKASWLISDWTAIKWQTYGGKKTRRVGDEWKGTVNVNWDIQLPDGRRLTDPCYSKLLETLRQAVFLYREGLVDGKAPAIVTWHMFCKEIVAIACWIVLQGQRYQPSKHGLHLLDQAGLRQLFAALGKDGWTGAMCLVERTLDAFHQNTFGIPCPSSLLENSVHLPIPERDAICKWLTQKGAYINGNQARKQVSRAFVADLIAAPTISLRAGSNRLNAALHQFAPDMIDSRGLMLSHSQTNELPSHRTRTLESALSSKASPSPIHHLSAVLIVLLKLYRHIPQFLPDPATLDLAEATSVGFQLCSEKGRTPFVPLDTGLRYLNEAIRWVHCYGDALVDYYILVAEKLVEATNGCGNDKSDAYLALVPAVLASTPLPKLLRDAGFKIDLLLMGLGNSQGFEILRTNPTLHQALRIWAGAVVILIGLLKPSRESEVAHLHRQCLIGEGPYWLDSELAKRVVREYRASTGGKPIPTITARAIQQMQRLGSRLVVLFNESDSYKRDQLFYLPAFNTFGRGTVPNNSELNFHLDIFCDYVGLPPDELGRRWYIRIHEMRKFFLLFMFWAGRYDVLDAAREIAGHVDVQHLYAYIEREFGAELPKLEGEYAADRLRQYDQTRISYEGEIGLNELYERVLTHFGVEQLELIPERTWNSYVQELRNQDAFHLEPYTIRDQHGYSHLCVAFKSTNAEGNP